MASKCAMYPLLPTSETPAEIELGDVRFRALERPVTGLLKRQLVKVNMVLPEFCPGHVSS
jgi:hypothetical protein